MPTKKDVDVELIIQNEQEWRRYLMSKIDNIESRLSALELLGATLKIKMGMISMAFGAIGSGAFQAFLAMVSR
jgi:hypothetical protein